MTVDARLVQIGCAHGGIAGANLLEVADVNGNVYHWADRRIKAPNVIPYTPATIPWLEGASIIVPSGPASVLVCFDDGGLGNSFGGYGDSLSRVDFDGAGGAVLTYLGSLGTTTFSSGIGCNDVVYVSPTLGKGPTQIADSLVAGSELVLQLFAYNGHTYVSGPTLQTVNDHTMAEIYWTVGSLVDYSPWLLNVPELTFHRSSVADIGNFVVQNLSGDTLNRDVRALLRASSLEGALFSFRHWDPAAEAGWLDVRGKLTVIDDGPDTITLKALPGINPAEDDMPMYQFCETCQWDWGSPQCGSTQSTECNYSFEDCQMPHRFGGVLNSYEKNFGETEANVPTNTINRRRRI